MLSLESQLRTLCCAVHGYVIGATNALFKAKRDLADVVVEIDEDAFEVRDPELRRALALTTEDLRFIDQVRQWSPNSYLQSWRVDLFCFLLHVNVYLCTAL